MIGTGDWVVVGIGDAFGFWPDVINKGLYLLSSR